MHSCSAPMAPSSSSLFFLISSSVWVALSLPLVMMPAVAAADGQGGGENCLPVTCGNVTIAFPFGLIPEDAVRTNCGGGIGSQVRCHNNDDNPYLGYYQSESCMQILSIFYHNRSLLIADRPWYQYFNGSAPKGCRIPEDNISSKLAAPLSVSPANQNLVFYNCTKPPSRDPGVGLVETVCHGNTFVRVADGRSDEIELEGCSAAMVPVLGMSGKVNASDYEQLVWDGYLAIWQLPPGNFTLAS